MTDPETSQAIFLGITLKDAITAILIPIVAVMTTLLLQDLQQKRERRMQILRMLMSTRHLPADPHYNAAINLIPVEFNKERAIMAAWRAYIEQVRFRPARENQQAHEQQNAVKQTKLITAIMRKMGLKHSEAEVQSDAYASSGFVWRDDLYLDSLKAQRDAANAMKEVAGAMKAQAALLFQQATSCPPPNQGGNS
jgi:hypothetical protein